MVDQRLLATVFTFVIGFHYNVQTLPLDQFFYFGPILDTYLPANDDGFVMVPLRYPFKFFNQTYQNLYVDTNGAISFGQGISNYTPICGPSTIPMIAPYWADVDIRFGGNISYRESAASYDLDPATEQVTQAFPLYQGINLLTTFIVTWYQVPFFDEVNYCNITNITNTFQLVLTTDGSSSFVIFNYNSTVWTTGLASGGDCNGLGGVPAKVGFDVGDNTTFIEVPGSCTASITNIVETGNGNNVTAGRYLFQVDSGLNSASCDSFTSASTLKVTPSFVPINGHVPIQIQGPCLSGVSSITCDFQLSSGLVSVPATQVGTSDIASCIVPYLDTFNKVALTLTLTRNGNIEEYYGQLFVMEQPYGTFPFIPGTSGNVSIFLAWLTDGFGNASTLLDLVLLEGVGRKWVERSILARSISNDGYNFETVPFGTPNISSAYAFRLTTSPAILGEIQTVPSFKPSVFSPPLYLGPTDNVTSTSACQTWFQNDDGPPPGLIACPPTLDQIKVDFRYTVDLEINGFYYSPGAENSYRQRTIKKKSNTKAPTQQCNYANGTILIGSPGGGTADMVSPIAISDFAHFVADIIPWNKCCRYSGDDAICRDYYYVKRPSDPGTNYVAPPIGMCGGDPHIVTFDKLAYTFNAVGEFKMIQSTNFKMQGRMVQYVMANGTLSQASVFTAFAMRQEASTDYNASTIQISVQPSGYNIYIDNKIQSLDPDQALPINLPLEGVSISVESTTKVIVDFSSGLTFSFTTADNNTSLNLIAMADQSLYGQLTGLMGYFDGQLSNDLRTPTGTTLPSNSTTETIHTGFGILWRTNASESIFTYTLGKSHASYQNPSFTPSYTSVDPNSLPADARAICGNISDCAYDYSNTGNLRLASDTAALVLEFNYEVSTLTRPVPTCSPLQNPVNGYFKADNFLVGSNATFYCKRSFKLVGYNQLQCIGSNTPAWNHNSPTCVACCLDCTVCTLWASLWKLLHILTPPPLCIPSCCPLDFY